MRNNLEILKTVVDAHGIQFRFFQESLEGIEDFDDGLRRQLYQNYDFGFIMKQVKEASRQ